MSTENKRAHARYPLWLPVEVTTPGGSPPRSGTLCDLSEGGALVWGYWQDETPEVLTFSFKYRGKPFALSGNVVATEPMWDTVIAHLRFPRGSEGPGQLQELLDELRQNFEQHQKYLAFRADDDPGLGRTSTQYPGERASA